MSIVRLKYLFHQFINRCGTPEETQEFLAMLRQTSYNEEVQSLLDELWVEPSAFTPLKIEKAEKIFNQIINRSQAADKSESPHKNVRVLWLRAVAAILIISGLSFIFYEIQFSRSASKDLTVQNVKQNKPLRRFMNLPDGSSVILNENSKIEYGSKFSSNGKREVYLTGEAYFDIIHDASHPFIVHTGELQVTVLGTAFNINASPENEIITVTVTRGKVKVEDSKQAYGVINPNEQIVYNKTQNQHITKQVKAEEVVEWKNDDLYFDDVSMNDIVSQLQERFHITFAFSNEAIKNCRFSATFLKSQNLEQILNVIAEFNQITYKFQNKATVLFEGEGCNYPSSN